MEITKSENKIMKSCQYGCSVMKIEKYEWGNNTIEYGFSLYKEEFGNRQPHFFRSVLDRLKHTWYTLIGKDYWLFDILLSVEEFEDFKNKVNNI